MRFLFISNLYPPSSIGGYELACHDVARALKRRSHQVAVLTSGFTVDETISSEAGVHRRLLLRRGYLSSTGRQGVARSRLEAEWRNARVTRQLLEAFQPDFVLCWNAGNLGRSVISVAEQASVVAYYLMDEWLLALLSHPMRRLGRLTLGALGISTRMPRAEHLIFVSEALRSRYQSTGLIGGSATVVYNGVSPVLFAEPARRRAQSEPQSPPRLLYVGRIAPDKGVTTLVNALGIVRRSAGMENVRLSLVGRVHEERYRAKLERMIHELGLRDAVEFVPHRPRSALPELYGNHELLVFPSEWDEPFALTLLEAMAVGLPVISTVTGGSAEVIRDRANALAFAAGDADDLAVKIAWALAHPAEMQRMASAARADVRLRFTMDAQADAIESFARTLLRRQPLRSELAGRLV